MVYFSAVEIDDPVLGAYLAFRSCVTDSGCTRIKVKKWDRIKLKNFGTSKETIKEVKRNPTE